MNLPKPMKGLGRWRVGAGSTPGSGRGRPTPSGVSLSLSSSGPNRSYLSRTGQEGRSREDKVGIDHRHPGQPKGEGNRSVSHRVHR